MTQVKTRGGNRRKRRQRRLPVVPGANGSYDRCIMSDDSAKELTHVDEEGRARMVDVAPKSPTRRVARAEAFVRMLPATLAAIRDGEVAKGTVLGVARVAGIMASKKTSELIPLCHPLSLTSARVDFELVSDHEIRVVAEAEVIDRTGVEMEALTACSVAALTIYDMCKAIDRGMQIDRLRLIHKSGGKSGPYDRPAGS